MCVWYSALREQKRVYSLLPSDGFERVLCFVQQNSNNRGLATAAAAYFQLAVSLSFPPFCTTGLSYNICTQKQHTFPAQGAKAYDAFAVQCATPI